MRSLILKTLVLVVINTLIASECWASGSGVVGKDGDWKGPIPEEFKVKRVSVFEFSEKPVVTRNGDLIRITFTSKGFCDATVAVEDGDGKIIRHLASGVLGPNAPEPFQKNALKQTVMWDGKDDQGRYPVDKNQLTIRVSLGLKPQFEKTLLWSPHKQRGSMPMFAAAPEGVYVYDARGVDHLRLFDHDGNYLRTIYPFPANKLKDVKGLFWHTFPQGHRWPLKHSLYQQTLLTSGVNDHIHDRYGMTGAAASGIAVKGKRIALGFEHLNRLSTDGTTGGLTLKGPEMGYKFITRNKRAYQIGPASQAFSPDGKTLYYTGWLWKTRFDAGSIPAVMSMKFESNEKPQVFAGSWDQSKFGKGDDQFCVPTSVACGPKGNVYVSDFLNNRVQVFAPSGKLLKSIKTKKPAKVLVHQKTGSVHVFSWESFGIPKPAWKVYGYNPKDIQPGLTSFSAFPECKKLSAEPFPFSNASHFSRTSRGQRYHVEIDSWAPGDEPTFWLMHHIRNANTEDRMLLFIDVSKELAEDRWIQGVRILKKRKGKWNVTQNFGQLAKKKVKRINTIRHNIQELFVNPATGNLFVGEADSGPVSKCYNRLIEIDPKTGEIKFVPLPFNAEELVFDLNGLAYLRTTDVVARYDSKTWREVPWDYGEELTSVSCGMGGRRAQVISGIRMPSIHPGCFQQGGMSISPKGHLVVACHQVLGKSQGKKWHNNYAHFGVAKDYATKYQPQIYPGRPSSGTCLHIWDKHGQVIRQDVVMGLPSLDGVHIDKDDNIYAMGWPTRVLKGKLYFNYMSETLMKFSAGKGKILTDSKTVPVPLSADLKPSQAKDLTARWTKDAEWLYGGVGFAGFNTPHANGGCACWYSRFSMDYFARSFAPEIDQYSVAILDSNGNLITRVGTYGNVDDGVPLDKVGGPANPRSLGGDEVALFHASYVATHTDHRLFIADLGNARLQSVKLNYHATAKTALKDVPNQNE